jgi:hypothetical protein
MKQKHQRTLELIFTHSFSANIQWRDIEVIVLGLWAEVSEREGSRVEFFCLTRFGYFTVRTRHPIQTKVRLRPCVNG